MVVEGKEIDFAVSPVCTGEDIYRDCGESQVRSPLGSQQWWQGPFGRQFCKNGIFQK
jgi:hypothetical protein